MYGDSASATLEWTGGANTEGLYMLLHGPGNGKGHSCRRQEDVR
jgi:hypothetical protein